MAENYLITGYHGTPHITAENDRGINAGIFGTGRFVLPVGEQFRAENIGNNTIRMYDGKLIDNGAAAGIPAGSYIDFVIPAGAQSTNRIDIIAFQYSKDSSTMIETGTFEVVSGTETSGTPEAPGLTKSDLLSGNAQLDQMGLYSVTVENGAITDISTLFTVKHPVSSSGDTMYEFLRFERTIGNNAYSGYIGLNRTNGNVVVGGYKDGEETSYMGLFENSTGFKNPVGVSSGGTGASNAADARANLGITPANIGAASTNHGTHVSFATGTPLVAGTGSAGSANTVARSDHRHPAQTEVTGNAGTATKLKTARTIQTNLSSSAAVEFDGSKSVTPGVTGVLPFANGGTGVKLSDEAPVYSLIRVNNDGKNLWYTPTGNGAFYATATNGAPTFGTLPVEQGGTGATTPAAARTKLGITPANIGALPLTGGTLTGTLTNTVGSFTATKTVDDVDYRGSIGVNGVDGGTYVNHRTGDAEDNFLYLTGDTTNFKVPLSISGGGTGGATAEEARTKLGVAPSGYGVGDTAKTITSLAEVLKSGQSGKYKGNNVAGAPNEYYWYFDAICMGTTYGTVNAYHSELINLHCRAVFHDGKLGDWEWDNPPMYENVEYKTTRMAAGSKIYTKRITYTNAAAIGNNSTTTDIEIEHGITNFAYLQAVRGKIGTYALPYTGSTGGSTSIARVTSQAVIVRLYNTGWVANQTFTIDLEYTKSS